MGHPADAPPVRRAAALMAAYGRPWAVAGGWAIDLFLGRETRPHADLDIATLRSDQRELQRLLVGANARKAKGGVMTPWYPGEELTLPVHEIHARWPSGETMEFLLNDVDPATNAWVFRRAVAVRRPMDRVLRAADEIPNGNPSAIPFLSPEIVLLYKAKLAQPRDEADLVSVLPHLDREQRHWLASAIGTAHGAHPWLESLARVSHSS